MALARNWPCQIRDKRLRQLEALVMRINPNALPSAPFEMIVLAKEVDVTNDTYGQLVTRQP